MQKPSKQELGTDVLTDLNKVGVDSDLPVELQGKTLTQAVASTFQYANDGKMQIADAVTAKGVTASSTDTFSALATKIGQIQTSSGARTNTGTVTVVTSSTLNFVQSNGVQKSSNYVDILLSDIGFTPSTLLLILTTDYTNTMLYNNTVKINSNSVPIITVTATANAYHYQFVTNANINTTRIQLPVGAALNSVFNWIAIE